MIQVRVETHDISRLANLIGAAGARAPMATARTINKTARDVSPKIAREVVALTGLPYQQVRRRITIKSATAGNLEAVITANGKPIALKFLKPRQTPQGVSYLYLGKREVRARAFQAPGGTWTKGDPKKRRATLGGHIVVANGEALVRQFSPDGIAGAFVHANSQRIFFTDTGKMADELARQLLAIIEDASWSAGSATGKGRQRFG